MYSHSQRYGSAFIKNMIKMSYSNIHWWLRKIYGKANKCENSKCIYKNPKRFEWALLKGRKYERNRKNYIMLCPSCHRKYDETPERKRKISEANKKLIGERNPFYGRHHSEETKQRISETKKKQFALKSI